MPLSLQAAYVGYDCLALKRTLNHWSSKLETSKVNLSSANKKLDKINIDFVELENVCNSYRESLKIIKDQIKAWRYIADSNSELEEVIKKFQLILVNISTNTPEILAEIDELQNELYDESYNLDPNIYQDIMSSLAAHKEQIGRLASEEEQYVKSTEFLNFLKMLNERNISVEQQITVLNEERIRLERLYNAIYTKVNKLKSDIILLKRTIENAKIFKTEANKKVNEIRPIKIKFCEKNELMLQGPARVFIH